MTSRNSAPSSTRSLKICHSMTFTPSKSPFGSKGSQSKRVLISALYWQAWSPDMSMKQFAALLQGTKLRLFLVESMHNQATARLTVSVIDDEATLSMHYQGKRQEIARIEGLQRTERQKGRD